MIFVFCVGVIYPEFCSRTPPPTYIASMMDYEDRRRRRHLSFEDVETVPSVSTSAVVEPVPATPPPQYHSCSTVRGMPVYCPRALRSRPHSFVANDSTHPATSGSSRSTIIVRAHSSSKFDVVKCTESIGHDSSLKSERSAGPSVSFPRSNVDGNDDSCSSDDS